MPTAIATRLARSNFTAVKQGDTNDPLVLSYLGLRKAVGIVGLALPFVLIFGKMVLQGGGIEDSISSYYYTGLGKLVRGESVRNRSLSTFLSRLR